jgi:predicted DsbA family dithiol-disulfide isomerase
MPNFLPTITMLFTLLTFSVPAQTGKKMPDNKNPLLCDPQIGICEIPGAAPSSEANTAIATPKPVKVIYFTDPICSSCWGIEPQLRKLKLEYGDDLEIEYRMGGLLPDWSYNSGGISKPSDVAHHWDEVSIHYDMPIDGDVWLEDPLDSSYPPSVAFKAAEMQDSRKALLFMRAIREMVFLQKKNITRWEHLNAAAVASGLDPEQMKKDMEGRALELFQEDLKMGRSMGVRGFPTMFFLDAKNNRELVYGSKPYAAYEAALLKLSPASVRHNYDRSTESLFAHYSSLTAREYSELSGTPRADAASTLQSYTEQGFLERLDTKNGSLWRVRR